MAKNRENGAVISLFNGLTPCKTHHETVPEKAVSKIATRMPSKNSRKSSKVLPDIYTNRDRGYEPEELDTYSITKYNKMLSHFDRMDSPKAGISFENEVHFKKHISNRETIW